MTVQLLGYDIENRSLSKCIADITDNITPRNKNCCWLACINPHSYVVAKSDKVFSQALKQSDWLVPDGIGIVHAGRILGQPLAERITGFEIFENVMQHVDQIHGRVFFLGSTEKTLNLIAERILQDYPHVTLAGIYSPPFKNSFSDKDNFAMIDAITAAQPDVLWVGMTAPKQEKWIQQHRQMLPVAFAGAIGAVFDFYSGQVKRSHSLFQNLGLEWLPRLLKQPRRLWRRMFISAPIFLVDVLNLRLRRKAKC